MKEGADKVVSHAEGGCQGFVVGEGTGSRIYLVYIHNYRWQHKWSFLDNTTSLFFQKDKVIKSIS